MYNNSVDEFQRIRQVWQRLCLSLYLFMQISGCLLMVSMFQLPRKRVHAHLERRVR